MAFDVKLYTFSKKENSTAQPPASALVRTESAVIKQPSGIMEPVMRFTIDGNPTACNYAYISDFGRYYYIQDWTSEPGKIWTASMRVDALASWKSYIGSESFYVLRASNEKDGDIMDAMYPAKDTFTVALQPNLATPAAWWELDVDPPSTPSDWIGALSQGYYILGVLSYTSAADLVGGVNYVAMIPAQLYTFLRVIFDTANSTATSSLPGTYGNAIQQVFTDAANITQADAENLAYMAENAFTDYIKSIVWVPDAPVGTLHTTGLTFGRHILNCGYYELSVKDSARYLATFNCPKHPLTNSRGSYVNCEPFTEVYALLPKMGAVKIPADLLAAYTYCFIELRIDPITGEGRYRLLISDSNSLIGAVEINRWYAQIGVQIQIAQTNDIGGRSAAFAGITGAVLNTLSNPGSITQLPAAIAEYQRKREANGQTVGAAGGWLGLAGNNGTPFIYGIHYDIADDDNTQNGRPLCKVRTPSALGGYMMIQDADVSAPASMAELQEIRSYMEGGFYYE